MIRVLIADDHAIVREGLTRILEDATEEFSVDEAEDGHQALARAREGEYDVILLDIAMPGLDGMDVLKQLKLDGSAARILMLTMYPEAQFASRALRAGAAGYLTKDRAPEELVRAIRKVAAGRRYITDSLAERIAGELEHGADKPLHELLSDREFQVFRLLAAGNAVSAIAEQLALSAKTVSTYRSRILQKTGMSGNAELTTYAVRHELIP